MAEFKNFTMTNNNKFTQRYFLQYCSNRFGDFKVARVWRSGENKKWTKWRNVLSCWESNEGLRFLDTVNNRTGFPCEIRLDLDDNITESKLNQICKILDEYKFKYRVYFSGSKSYHIHVIDQELMLISEYRRECIRDWLIEKTGCDPQLAKTSHMIALENVPHWKTGKIKTLIRGEEWEI